MAKSKVLVSGGFGYVGSRLVPFLLEKGYEIAVLDLCLYGTSGYTALHNDARWSQWKQRFTFVEGDIRDPEAVSKSLHGCQAVIHLAAISNDPTGEIDEILTRQVNFDAVGLLLVKAKEAGVKRFINASSSSVFGLKKEEQISESLEPEPLTSYSKYKMLAEWLVFAAHSQEFCTVNIRPATICGYSPRQRFDLTVNKLTADAVRKNLITVHGGQQRRPNVGMTDMINLYGELLEVASEKINGQTFNFGFENHKIIDIAAIIKEQIGTSVSIKVTETFDQRDYHISSEKIAKILGYKPKSSISKEVESLRCALATNFSDSDAAEHYNMKCMNLRRNATAYHFLGC